MYQLRPIAATELVNSGVGVGTVRQLLGHRNLQTTQHYAELSGRAGYNYASSSTVRHELDAFARKKTRTR
ncbi:MAG: tyrosine-type recombinase/integrase [Gemmatimonadetes bacterium]|nr:tyrosine-type recombinase/integrase [Gemmatimonadota bacterium]